MRQANALSQANEPAVSPAGGGSIDRRALSSSLSTASTTGYAGDTLASALHRQRRASHRALVQVPPSARNPERRRRGAERAGQRSTRGPGRRDPEPARDPDRALSRPQRFEPEPLALALVRPRRASTTVRAAVPRWFLLQDLHGPEPVRQNWAWTASTSRMIRRAAGLGSAPARARSGPLPAHLRPLRRADHRWRPRRPRGGAGGSRERRAGRRLRRAAGARRLASRRGDGRRSTGKSARRWLADDAAPCLRFAPNVPLLTRTTAFGYYAQNFVALDERVTDHLVADPEHAARAAYGRCGRAKSCSPRARSSGRSSSRQRPPRRHAGRARRGAISTATASRSATASSSPPRTTAPIAPRSTCRARASRSRDRRSAPRGPAALADARGRAGIERHAGARIAAPKAACGSRRAASMRRGRGAERVACDALLMSGGWTPSVHLFSQSAASWPSTRRSQVFMPGETAERDRSAGAGTGTFALRQRSPKATPPDARGGRGRLRDAARPEPTPSTEFADVGDRVPPSARPAGPARESLRRFPERRNARRIWPGRPRGHPLDRARQALHHHRDGDRPGQDLQHERAWPRRRRARQAVPAGRADDVPAALYAGDASAHSPALRAASCSIPIRRTPIHEWAAAEGAVFEDVGQWKRACYFREAGENMRAAVARECRATRASVGIFDVSTLGKIEVVGPDAATFLERMYINDFRSSRSGDAATASCSARPVSSWTTA